ncbi:MAG: PocR ligand-binding domain-containing protein [Desulfatibacillaceae bacterium]
MKLLDIAPRDVWANFEKEMHERFSMSCSVNDTEGMRVTEYENWGNELCPTLKEHKEALATICAAGSQNFTQMAKLTGNPVVGMCDAGLLKISVPIFLDGEFLGTAGGCGALSEGEEMETFLVEKTTGMSGDEIRRLARGMPTVTEEEAWELADFCRRRLSEIVSGITSGIE